MRIYIDRADGKFVSSPGYNVKPRLKFKRGDAGALEIAFYNGAAAAEMAVGSLVKFGLKEDGKYDGSFLVYLDEWTRAANVHSGEVNFNTTELNDLLLSGDADESNDVGSVSVMLEVSWSEDAGDTWTSSETLAVTVDNDVIKGGEGSPTSANPAWVDKFLGTFVSLVALDAAYPAPAAGSFAHVDAGVGEDVKVYIWDNDDAAYVEQAGAAGLETAASVKDKYESNSNTNAFTDAEKAKLGDLSEVKTIYVRAASDGFYTQEYDPMVPVIAAPIDLSDYEGDFLVIANVDVGVTGYEVGEIFTVVSAAMVQVTDLSYKESGANKGAAGGYAPLDSGTKIPFANIPDEVKTYLNVKAYGAVGDGVADDTISIQSAIDSAAVTSATVFFPVGVYRVTKSAQTGFGEDKQSLNLHSGITILGESREGVIIKPMDVAPNNMPLMIAQDGSSDNITIQNLSIDGNKDRASVGGGGDSEDEGINFKNGNFCGVIDCNIFNCGQDAIDADGGSYLTVSGCHIYDNYGNGIHMAGAGMSRAFIRGNIVTNNAHGRFLSGDTDAANSASGIDNKGGNDIILSGNILTGNARGYTNYGAVRVTLSACNINSGNSSGGSALSLRGTDSSGNGDVTAIGCHFISGTGAGNQAVKVEAGFRSVTFVGGYIRSNVGILMSDGGELNICGKVTMDSTSHNIHILENRGRRVDVDDTIFTAARSGNDLRVESDAYGDFTNNTMLKTGSSIVGVDLRTGSGNWTLRGNTCDTNLKAVRISAGTHKLIDNDLSGSIEVATGNNKFINNRLNNVIMNFTSRVNNEYRGNEISGAISGTSYPYSQKWKGNYGAGAYPEKGVATLVAGTVTVSSDIIPSGAMVGITRQSGGGTLGHLSLGTVTQGVSLVLESSSAGDTSTVLWEILQN